MTFPAECAGWVLERSRELPEYQATALYYRHAN